MTFFLNMSLDPYSSRQTRRMQSPEWYLDNRLKETGARIAMCLATTALLPTTSRTGERGTMCATVLIQHTNLESWYQTPPTASLLSGN